MQLAENVIAYSDSLGIALDPAAMQGLLHPSPLHEGFFWLLWTLLLVWFVAQGIRRGTLGFSALLFISMTTTAWMDPYASWSAYMIYSPKYLLMAWDSALTSPNKPWVVWADYGLWNLIVFSLMIFLMERLRRAKPGISVLASAFIVAMPILYLYDLLGEGAAVANGYWSYLKAAGPVLVTAKGTLPLVYPAIVYSIWGAINAFFLANKDPDGRPKFEHVAWLDSMPAGLGKELARVLVWCAVMNASYCFLFTGPIVLVRYFGIV